MPRFNFANLASPLRAGLPGLALASVLSAAPGFAAAQAPSPTMVDANDPVMVANLSNIIRDVNRGVRDVQQTIEQQQRQQQRQQRQQQREQQQRDREAARQQAQQEREAARQAAAEQRRLAAERERQYFESLSPEQQQAYLAEKRAREAAQVEAAASLLMLFLGSGGGGSAPESSNPDYIYVPDNTYRPTPQPAAPSVAPINPFYGNGPAY